METSIFAHLIFSNQLELPNCRLMIFAFDLNVRCDMKSRCAGPTDETPTALLDHQLAVHARRCCTDRV